MQILKSLFFTEVSPLVKKAKTKIIDESDLLPLPADIDPRVVSIKVEKVNWRSPVALLFSMVPALRKYMLPAYSWYGASAMFSLLSPVLIHRFVSYVSAGVTQETLPETLVVGILLGFCGFLSGFCIQHYFKYCLRANQVMTNFFNEKIFRHSLKLSLQARQKNQLGDIVNYMGSDSESVADFALILADLLYAFGMIIAIVAMLFYYIGWSTLSAIAVLLILAPLTKIISKTFTVLDDEMMAHRDQRVTLMTQALNAIRVVKYFAWEKSVIREVNEVRAQELAARSKLARAETTSSLGYLGVSTFVLFAALATHAWRGEKLDAALIFTCISLFGLLEGPFGDLSRLISRFTQAKVGARRILHFLKQEEVPEKTERLDDTGQSVGLTVEHLTVSYNEAVKPVLQNISFQVAPGKSLAVVGPVGSGKSSLIYSLLGEIPSSAGSMTYTGLAKDRRPRVAYVPQEAYIVNTSLLENLKFGEEVSGEEIRRSLVNACLDKDLKEWKAGLRTEIGEKGVNLSGGQKQRVALARAYLSRPQVVLLDDPLSAVDADTENLLCERLLFGAWKEKTRIVVTHRLEHLDRFDQVLYLEQGIIKGLGSFADLKETCPEFVEFYAEHGKTQGAHEAQTQAEATPSLPETVMTATEESRVTEDEDREVGAVKGSVYWDYISSLGGDGKHTKIPILILLFGGAILTTLLPLAQKSWLSYYSNHSEDWQALVAVGIYGVIGILVLFGSLLNDLFWLSRGIQAGRAMHDKMLNSVLRAPVRFFDSTPVGRVIQRFSRDIESVDIYLQWSFSSAVRSALQVIVALFLILSLMPMVIIVIAPVMLLYYFVQRDYRRPAREAKRLDSIARSPRYAHFKESLQGLVVIRGFSKSDWFLQNFYDKLAHSQRMFFSHYMLNRWLSSRIPLIGGLISMGTAVGVSLSAYYGAMSSGVAGLVTMYSLSFWAYLNWGVRIFADIESRMTSVERLKYFANLPAEKDVTISLPEPLRETWPEFGSVEVNQLKARYAAHLPQILNGLTFKVDAGTRVGIIGRTGSGKSTFFQSLFRFIEAEEGSIMIDGVNIAGIPLERLRRSLAIIPQDPTLFMGTIRNNLDRYNEYTDDEIITALKHAFLWDHVESLPQGLHAPVTEGGLNLSQGQRQLLCLARALLTQARVIVMDEATASVDVQTDALLQKVIREAFVGVTMLIIAHRLGTIADCDQIVEFSAGAVKSVRRPHEISEKEIEESLV